MQKAWLLPKKYYYKYKGRLNMEGLSRDLFKDLSNRVQVAAATSTEFFDSLPPPPSFDPLGISHLKHHEISPACDSNHSSTDCDIHSLLELRSATETRDNTQNMAIENDIGRFMGST